MCTNCSTDDCEQQCCLCRSSGGALEDNNWLFTKDFGCRWAHRNCLLWCPDIFLGTKNVGDNLTWWSTQNGTGDAFFLGGVKKLFARKGSTKCSMCKQSGGMDNSNSDNTA